MATLVLHGRLGRSAPILEDSSARMRAERTIAGPGHGRNAMSLRAIILVVGYPIAGIAVIWLSALISALAAAVLSGIYMVIVACIILYLATTSLAASDC